MNWTARVTKQVLPNGLTVLAQRDPSTPVVAVVTHVRAGYFDEPDEWTGIAHVLEHMYFKGTPRRAPGQIARETQLAGGYINAATIYDKTVYYTVLPSADEGVVKALDVQSDALINAALDAGDLTRELKVIVEEVKRKLDTPAAVATETLYELLFTVHRMRRWRMGTEDQLSRLTASEVQTYYRTRYTPERVIVGIAGDVDTAEAVRLAERFYGAWDRAGAEVPGSPAEPPGRSPRARVLFGDVARPMAVFGWKTVGALHADTPALDVTAAILGSGRGARLYRALRAPGIASAVGAYHYTPTEVGVFAVSLESEPHRFDDALDMATRLVARLARDGPTEAELKRVRGLLATQWSRRFEAADGRAAVLCEGEALGDYHLADHLYRRTMEVGARDVRRVARRYLDVATAGAVCYLPDGTNTMWGDGGWPPSVVPAPAGVATPPSLEAVEAADGAVRAVAARPATTGVRRFPGAIAQRRCEGVDFVVRPKGGAGLVTVGVHLPGLRTAERSDTAGVSWLLARAALRGAGGLSAERLAAAAESLGGPIVPNASADALGWWITVQPDAVPQAAELLRCVALDPHLDAGEVTLERDLLASDARSVRDDMFRYPVQQVRAAAFPDHAYGLPALGVPETVQSLSLELVRDWAERVHRQHAVVVAVGDLAVPRLLEGLGPLEAWPAGDGDDRFQPASPRWVSGRGGEERQKAQTALAMAFSAPWFGSPDRYVISVLCSLLSGLAGRLFDELRERRSLAYTVAAMPWLAARAGAVLTYIATSPAREAEARDVMVAELRRVAREPVAPDELERARRYAAGTVEVRRQSGQAVAEELLAAWLYDTMEEVAETPDRLRSVTAEDLERVAGMVFRESERAEYVVRGRSNG